MGNALLSESGDNGRGGRLHEGGGRHGLDGGSEWLRADVGGGRISARTHTDMHLKRYHHLTI